MNSSLSVSLALGASLVLASAAHADILVGVAAPLTGPNAAVGEQFRKGDRKSVV